MNLHQLLLDRGAGGGGSRVKGEGTLAGKKQLNR